MTQPTITINEQSFALVCIHDWNGRATYRGLGTYLRIGPPIVLEPEETIHRQLIALGFPVAAILQTGEHTGQHFFVETALGDKVLGDIFETEMRELNAVSEISFGHLLTVVHQWVEAQLRNAVCDGTPADLARTVRLADLERLLPELTQLTRQAFALAQQRLAVFPTVLTHGDFHPHNICAGGVIDLEMVHWSVAGYDVISGLFGDDLFPPDLADYRYTPQQLAEALGVVEDLFHTYRLPPPSSYIDDFRLCRMMRIVELAEHRSPDIQQWIYHQYETQATVYVTSTDGNALISRSVGIIDSNF